MHTDMHTEIMHRHWSGPPDFIGFQLLDFCCSSVSELVLSTHLVHFGVLYVCCFDSLMSQIPSCGPNTLYVYELQQNLWRGLLQREPGLSPHPSNLLLTVPRRCFCCGLFTPLIGCAAYIFVAIFFEYLHMRSFSVLSICSHCF